MSKSPPIMPRPPERVTEDSRAPPAKPAMGALMMRGDEVQGSIVLRADMITDVWS